MSHASCRLVGCDSNWLIHHCGVRTLGQIQRNLLPDGLPTKCKLVDRNKIRNLKKLLAEEVGKKLVGNIKTCLVTLFSNRKKKILSYS